jgi:sugar lactone lactonase YvrE
VIDSAGYIYVAEAGGNHRIRKISPTGLVTTLAGSHTQSGEGGFIDGPGTTAMFRDPSGVALDSAGNVYVADNWNRRIRKIDPDGYVITLAGDGSQGIIDGLGNPQGITLDSTGNIYVTDGLRIGKIDSNNDVTILAGSTQGFADGQGTAALFNNVIGITVNSAGYVYVADSSNNRIRMISPNGNVTTFAGSATAGSVDGQRESAQFWSPQGITIDSAGNFYIADTRNNRIRMISPDGNVTTLAGGSTEGFTDGLGSEARFNNPRGITVDSAGNLYVADSNNHLIRKMVIVPVD